MPINNRRSITIRATDTSPGIAAQTTETFMTIEVTQPAMFTISAQPNPVSLDEMAGERIDIATLNATYANGAQVHGVAYTIDGPANHPFEISGGAIIVPADKALDHEATQSYTLTIAANVGGSTADPITVTVNVGNIDDENPTFDMTTIPINATIQAGATNIVPAVDVDATDDFTTEANAGNPEAEISYAFVGVVDNFAIDPNTGEITVVTAPNFTGIAADVRMLTIRATDTSLATTAGQTAETTITVTVTQPNTFTIAATPNMASIDERAAGSRETLATLNATYAGGSPVNGATYTIAAPAVHPFMIEGNELVIPAGASLDHEATPSYTLTIAANVAGSTTSPIPVTVNVGNIDDEDPVFSAGAIPEGVAIEAGTTTFTSAIDIDATDDFTTIANAGDPEAEISYAFVDGAQLTQTLEGFTINANTGEITVPSAPTFSTTPTDNTRTLIIRATDTSPTATDAQTADATITITVTAPSNINLTSTEGLTITIDESDDAFIPVTEIKITTLGVTASTNNPYAIIGDPLGFAINNDGEITARLDYDMLGTASQENGITITAQARGSEVGQIATIALTIMVNNLDDENPVFETNTLPTGVTVRGESTNLSQSIDIDATDGDAPPVGNNNDISYAFVDGSDAIIAPNGLGLSILGNFAIDANTGEITVASAPTFSTTPTDNTRTLTIRATDTTAGATGQTADATITITVTPPATFAIAAAPNNTPSIDERTTGGKVTLATLNATYAGGASVQNATYTVANEVAHPFRISGNELVIPAGESLDYEATQSYTLTISANVDGSTADPITVTVNVGNIDDENPVFDNSTIPTNATVAAGTPIQPNHAQLVSAIDIDATDGLYDPANAGVTPKPKYPTPLSMAQPRRKPLKALPSMPIPAKSP